MWLFSVPRLYLKDVATPTLRIQSFDVSIGTTRERFNNGWIYILPKISSATKNIDKPYITFN